MPVERQLLKVPTASFNMDAVSLGVRSIRAGKVVRDLQCDACTSYLGA